MEKRQIFLREEFQAILCRYFPFQDVQLNSHLHSHPWRWETKRLTSEKQSRGREKQQLTMKKPGKHHLDEVIKVTSGRPPHVMRWGGISPPWLFFQKPITPDLGTSYRIPDQRPSRLSRSIYTFSYSLNVYHFSTVLDLNFYCGKQLVLFIKHPVSFSLLYMHI